MAYISHSKRSVGMRMLTYSSRLFLSLGFAALIGCGGAKTTNLAPAPPDKIKVPDWFLSTPTDANYLFAAATMTSRDMQMAIQKAETQARTNLAQQMETKISNLTKQFQEEVGFDEDSELLQQFTSATKVVTQQTLNGVRSDEKEIVKEKGIYRAYVLMSLPIGQANQLLMEKIRANQNLYTRFRATQAFEDLNKELEALHRKRGKTSEAYRLSIASR